MALLINIVVDNDNPKINYDLVWFCLFLAFFIGEFIKTKILTILFNSLNILIIVGAKNFNSIITNKIFTRNNFKQALFS